MLTSQFATSPIRHHDDARASRPPVRRDCSFPDPAPSAGRRLPAPNAGWRHPAPSAGRKMPAPSAARRQITHSEPSL
jgi:hypothetical protein